MSQPNSNFIEKIDKGGGGGGGVIRDGRDMIEGKIIYHHGMSITQRTPMFVNQLSINSTPAAVPHFFQQPKNLVFSSNWQNFFQQLAELFYSTL